MVHWMHFPFRLEAATHICLIHSVTRDEGEIGAGFSSSSDISLKSIESANIVDPAATAASASTYTQGGRYMMQRPGAAVIVTLVL